MLALNIAIVVRLKSSYKNSVENKYLFLMDGFIPTNWQLLLFILKKNPYSLTELDSVSAILYPPVLILWRSCVKDSGRILNYISFKKFELHFFSRTNPQNVRSAASTRDHGSGARR